MTLQYNDKQAGLSQQERLLIDSMVMRGKSVLQMSDVVTALGISKERATLMLSRLKKKGWLQKLKAGVYRIVPFGSGSSDPVPEDAMSIAMEIFPPGYIGGWTAAEYWDLTEQIFNATVFYTSLAQRKSDHKIAGLTFKTKSIPAEDVFGTTQIWPGNKPVLISDIHRTLIDILHDPSIGGGGRSMVDITKLYSKKKEANNGAVFKRLGIIAEKILKTPEDELEKIKGKRKRGIILLDPNGPAMGPILNRWGIRLNIP